MSSRKKDSGDDNLGIIIFAVIWLVIRLVIIGIVAGITYLVNKYRSTPRLPKKLEPGNNSGKSAVATNLGLIFRVIGVGIIVMLPFLLVYAGISDVFAGLVLFIIIGLGIIIVIRISRPVRDQPSALDNVEKEHFISENPKRYTIKITRNIEFNPDTGWRFIEALAKVVPHVIFRIVAKPHTIFWEILDWRSSISSKLIIQTIHNYYPSAEIEISDWVHEERDEYPIRRYTMLFQQAADFVWPIKSIADLKDFDPLVSITQAMSGLEDGEKIIYSMAMSIFAKYAYKEGEKMVTVNKIHPLQFLSANGTGLALSNSSFRRSSR